MRLIASLALMGLLASCQTVVVPPPTATGEPSATATGKLAPQPTSPLVGTIAGSWTKLPDMPTSRSGAATVVFENRIVVIGGLGGPQSVDRYDPATKMWDKMPDLPFAVDHAMAASIEEGTAAGIFLFGGFLNGKPSAKSWYLSRDEGDWREINPMPAPRIAGAAVGIGKKIYIVGGATTQRSGSGLAVFEFDLEGKPWSEKAPIPTARNNFGAVAVGGKVCAFGGRELAITRNLSAVECFDPGTNAWETLPPMPMARGGIAAAALGDRVVIAGGEEPAGVIAQVHVFDAKTRTWSRGPDLPTARQDLGMAAVGKVVYAIGGGAASATSSFLRAVEAWTLP